MFKARLRALPIAIVAIVFASLLASPAHAAATKYPITVKFGGYTTTIAKKPTKIISLSPSATEILYAVGAGSQILAVDNLSNYPANAPVSEISAFEPSVEAILAKKPDLVLLSIDSTKAPQIRNALVKLGIPVLMEKAPATLKDVYAENTLLARVTDRQAGAVKLNASMAKSIKDVLAKVKKSSQIRIFHELDDTYYSVTSNTFIGKVYKDFGAVNIADAAAGADNSGYPQLSAEYLLKSDPQVIFLADAQYGVTADSVSKRAGWSQISAVKNKKIVELPADIPSRWGPRLVDFYKLIGASLAKVS
ncbi:FepB ABC-type Fe3+-hydroxamate transport system, periplasmic component [Candidatus Nanopelagicaceae bacterium]